MELDRRLASEVWSSNCRFRPQDGAGDEIVEATWKRVAAALAEAEPAKLRGRWRIRFPDALEGYRFLPAADAPSAYPRCGSPGLVRKDGWDSRLDWGFARCE